MLSNIRKSKKEGFTIIEVLIVLAIAGLIMLVVFLAVPALQRNARNTQRSNDVAGILGAVNEYVSNNNGTLPGRAQVATDGTLTLDDTAVTTENAVTAKLGYYRTAGSVTVSVAAPPATNTTTTDTVVVYISGDCNSTNTAAVAGSARSVAANYTLEANARQCKAS